MELTKVLFNKYNAPRETEKYKSSPGAAIYKYSYYDKKAGKMIEEEINIQEKIQSYTSQVDYKKRIELGLGLEVPFNDGNTRDFTGLPDTTVDLVSLTNAIAGLSTDQIAYILQQSSPVVQTTDTTGQTIIQAPPATGETVPSSDTNNTTINPTGGQ